MYPDGGGITQLWSLPSQLQSPAHCLQQVVQPLVCCRYTGSLYVAAAGNYTFQLDTIQGAQLWVNNQLLIDQAGELFGPLQKHAVGGSCVGLCVRLRAAGGVMAQLKVMTSWLLQVATQRQALGRAPTQ